MHYKYVKRTIKNKLRNKTIQLILNEYTVQGNLHCISESLKISSITDNAWPKIEMIILI